MSGSLIRGGGENFPGIPGACATRNFIYLARSPLRDLSGGPHKYPDMVYIDRSVKRNQNVSNARLHVEVPAYTAESACVVPLKIWSGRCD